MGGMDRIVMAIRFGFSWIPFIATVIAAAIGLTAGQWQTRRALEKEAIEAKLQARSSAPVVDIGGAGLMPEAVEYGRVRVKGEFVRDWPIYLDNRPHQGRAGFYLLMPFKIAGTDQAVLVARGWFARDVRERTSLPEIPTPAGAVEIEGVARRHAARLLQFGGAAPLKPGAIVQNAEIADVAAAGKLTLLPFLIEQTSELQDGLVRAWPHPSSGVEKHRGYAFQWYGLAATAIIFFVVTGIRRGTKNR